MEIDIDVYFWMVDRGLFDDDQRNKVDLERNKVKLHRDHGQRFENGFYVGKIMLLLKKSIMKISKKPFTLDQGITNMKDNITSIAKQTNWNVLSKELKKFGIRIDSDKKGKIIEGRHQLINDILSKLFDFDNGGIQSGRFQDGNISEIQYAAMNDRDNSLNAGLNGAGGNDSTNISIDGGLGNTPIVLPNLKGNAQQLDPIIPKNSSVQQSTKQLSVSNSKQQIASLDSTPVNNPAKHQVTQSLTSLNDISESKDLAYAESTLEFILLSLSKSLQIKPKQAAGLLSNNHKYLVHIAVKGMKGSDYSKIQQWYQDIYQNIQQLVQLIDNEKQQNSVKLTLNILKYGLYSQNQELVINCCRVMSKIGQEINSIGGQLAGMAWDWFITQDQGSQGAVSQLPLSLNDVQVPDLIPGSSAFQSELSQTFKGQETQPLNESGLQSTLVPYNRFLQESVGLLEHLFPILVHFGKNNPMELFTFHLRNNLTGSTNNEKSQYLQFIHDLFTIAESTVLFKENLLASGVLDDWLNYGLRVADVDNFQINERVAAVAFLTDVWEIRSAHFEEQNNDMAQAILSIIKRGCRDKSKVLRVVSFELLFKLLSSFSQGRNQFAPIIYKSLTFLLIEYHMDSEIREQLMRHFISVFQQIQTIPVAILCEPLIKQIEISQQSQSPNPSILPSQQPSSQPSYLFNIFDFEFFNTVVHHKRLTIATALQVVDLMISIATTNIFFANTAISIILEVIHKFSREPALHQQFSQTSRVQLLTIIEECERTRIKLEADRKKQKEQRAKSLGDSIAKNQANRFKVKQIQDSEKQKEDEENQAWETANLARQTKEKLIVNLLKQVIQFGNDLIKQDLRNQLLATYSKLEKELKIKSKAIQYLLQLYGEDIPQMLQYYIQQEELMQTIQQQQQQEAGESKSHSSTNTEKINQQIENVSQTLLLLNQNNNQLAILENKDTTIQTTLTADKSPSKKLNLKAAQHLDKVLKDIEKVKNNLTLKNDKKALEEELKKARDDKVKAIAKKQVDQRKLYEHGVAPKVQQNRSPDARERGNDIQVKIIKHKDSTLLDLSEIDSGEGEQRLLIPSGDTSVVNSKAKQNPILKQLKQFQLYDLRLEEQKDQDAVRFFVKKNLRIFRNLFNRYANTTGPVTQVKETFDKLQDKNSLITVAEILKFLREFNLQPSCTKDQVIQMVRLINMDILKKKDKGQASLSVLEYEGFVEFMLQLAVHVYSYHQGDLSPAEYLQKLFDHMKEVAQKSGINNAKLFEDQNVTVGDQKLLAELNRRLQSNPQYQVPDGFMKVSEKEVVNTYKLPESLASVMKESQLISIELVDDLLNNIFGFHFIEPISEIKEVLKVRPNLKAQAKDKIMHEINSTTLNPKQAQIVNPHNNGRSRQNIRVSNSIDVNPIRNQKKIATIGLNNSVIGGNTIQQRKDQSSIFRSPRVGQSTNTYQASVISKPNLSVELKLEVAKAPAHQRAQILETAYVLEEILYSVENGLTTLPPPNFQLLQKSKIVNRVIEDKLKKQEQDQQAQLLSRQKLDLRKKILKDQLDKMKADKEVKDKEDAEKKKKEEAKEKARQQRKDQKKRDDIKKILEEVQVKKDQKQKEEEEKKKKEADSKAVSTDRLKQEIKAKLGEKKKKMAEEFKKKAEERKASVVRDEELNKKKQEIEKKKQEQIKMMYAETKNKQKEQKEKQRQGLQQYQESQEIKELFQVYEKSLMQQYEIFCKLDSPLDPSKLSYNSYLKLGNKLQITPTLISSQDFIYVYKTILRSKKENSLTPIDQLKDVEGTKLNFQDFKEALVKIACLSKFKLGGLIGSEEEIKAREEQMKAKQKLVTNSTVTLKNVKTLNRSINSSIAGGLGLNQQKDNNEEQKQDQNAVKTIQLPNVNIYEKDFEVSDMTQITLENLFKHIGLKIDKATMAILQQQAKALNKSIDMMQNLNEGMDQSMMMASNFEDENSKVLNEDQVNL